MGRPGQGRRQHARGVGELDDHVGPARARAAHHTERGLHQQACSQSPCDGVRARIILVRASDDGEHPVGYHDTHRTEDEPGSDRLPHRRAALAKATAPAIRPTPTDARRPWCCEAQTWGERACDIASNRPWAPKSCPSSPSAGSHRLLGWSGGLGSPVCWASKPVRARYRSSSPGAIALTANVAAVDSPTQYSRRRGCSAAYTTAPAATSGW